MLAVPNVKMHLSLWKISGIFSVYWTCGTSMWDCGHR